MAGNNAKNLKKRTKEQGNHGRGTSEQRKAAEKVKLVAQKLVDNPIYQAKLQEKMEDGTLHPSMQSLLWYYAYGKPLEVDNEKPAVPVKFEMVMHPDAVKAHEGK